MGMTGMDKYWLGCTSIHPSKPKLIIPPTLYPLLLKDTDRAYWIEIEYGREKGSVGLSTNKNLIRKSLFRKIKRINPLPHGYLPVPAELITEESSIFSFGETVHFFATPEQCGEYGFCIVMNDVDGREYILEKLSEYSDFPELYDVDDENADAISTGGTAVPEGVAGSGEVLSIRLGTIQTLEEFQERCENPVSRA